MNYSKHVAYDFVMVLLPISVVVLGIVLFFVCRKRKPPAESKESIPIKLCAKAYPLTDMDAATDGFNHRRIVGAGLLGTVYAGILPTGELVAIKRIHPRLVLSKAGFGFSSVLKSLSLAQHPHTVPILGFSEAPGERIILMEFVGMASLDFYLHQNSDGASLLDWSRRLRIAAGAARGIEYLHEGNAPSIIHGCIKASNILIDTKFCARVCDYGLYFLAPLQEKRGLAGCVDEEYWMGGNGGCKESDVYGFGVLLLEVLSGRRSEEGMLVKWALPLIKDMNFRELLDSRLEFPGDLRPFVRLAKVASACVSNSRKNRPSIVQVAAILNSLEMEMCV